jgi:uncharacterized protein YyaL (SSP411 family)
VPNLLSAELSPYLLQHAGNPVDWRPWGADALQLARRQEKPIFLSIGYASCHWCHVMAHESFEDAEIARLLNEHFVSIKVDREERPDLDQIYMDAVQIMSGRGGWPMSMFLTPEGKPFFGGTYWPPRARGGMSGFDEVLKAVADGWQRARHQLVEQADKITQLLAEETAGGQSPEGEGEEADRRVRETHRPTSNAADGAFHTPYEYDSAPQRAAEAALRQAFDPRHGGFGAAPKFPQPLALRWLLRRWRRTQDAELLAMVTKTLDGMAAGGMYDHLGGGFHRYSVDARWLVPHFEKMLYDNALLAACYLEAWQATRKAAYAAVVRQSLDYLLRDLCDPLGGFYGSEDADSEGEEGKFYVWTPGEIEAVLGAEAAKTFRRVYDVTETGNFEGRNILNLSRPLGGKGDRSDLPERPEGCFAQIGPVPFSPELEIELAAARARLLAARQNRVRPGRDEKVLVSWNSLAIDALARCGAAFNESRYTVAANAAADFLLTHLRRNDGRLLRYWRVGRAKQEAFLDDYAGLGNALLTLYETSGQNPRLDEANRLAAEILARFADRRQGGFFYTAADHERLIVRKKDVIDNPLPSGNGLAAMLLARLAAVTGRDDDYAAAEATLRACAPWMRQVPTGTFQLLLTADSIA